jgi:predicted Fe-Mo cluster-binding NifX family protein
MNRLILDGSTLQGEVVMKVAVASEDGRSVSRHFGRAPFYVVLTIDDGAILDRAVRSKAGHDTFAGAEPSPDDKHRRMAGPIADCEALIVGGMGDGAVRSMLAMGIQPVLTDESDVDQAGLRFARGDLPSLTDRVHRGRGQH